MEDVVDDDEPRSAFNDRRHDVNLSEVHISLSFSSVVPFFLFWSLPREKTVLYFMIDLLFIILGVCHIYTTHKQIPI